MSVLSFARLSGAKLILGWIDGDGRYQKDWFYVAGTSTSHWQIDAVTAKTLLRRVNSGLAIHVKNRPRGGLSIAHAYMAYRRARLADRKLHSVRGFNHHQRVAARLTGAA